MAKKKVRAPLRPGQRFKKKYRGREYELKVVLAAAGIQYKLGSRTFESPSGAAKWLTEHEVNGYRFWGID